MSSRESKKPKTEMDLTIIELPDKCLIPIFNKLSAYDLVSVYECCERFQPAAEYCFSKNYNIMKVSEKKIKSWSPTYRKIQMERHSTNRGFNAGDIMEIRWYNEEVVDDNTLLKAIRFFGKHLTEINVGYFKTLSPFQILRAANEYCGENLTILHLASIDAHDVERIDEIVNLLKRLEKFTILPVANHFYGKCLVHCDNLKELTVNRLHATDSILQKTFVNLEKFECFERTRPFNLTVFRTFLEKHPNLKIVNVMGMVLLGSPDYLNLVPNVETIILDLQHAIQLSLNKVDWVKLFQMPKLRTIKLALGMEIRGSLAKVPSGTSSSIETIEFGIPRLKDAADLLGTFTFNNLKVLKIFPNSFVSSWPIENVELKGTIVKAIKNLEEIHFDGFPSGFNNFLLKFVKVVPHLKVLVLSPRGINIDMKTILDLAALQKDRNVQLTIKSKYRINDVIEYANESGLSTANLKFLKLKYFDGVFNGLFKEYLL